MASATAINDPVRLLHFSDIHLTYRPLGWTLRDLASRRVTGWVNWYALGRAHRFRYADRAGFALVKDILSRRPDHIVFSGDATFLGFPREVERVTEVLRVGDRQLPPGLAVPGNHDWYTPKAVESRTFEKKFAPWQQGERIDSHTYPFAQRHGPLWLVAINSAAPSPWPWDASGEVGQAQRDRLRNLLRTLSSGPRILVTHYPVCLADGRPEKRWHGLRDVAATVRIASEGGVGLWLHGHRHSAYHRPPSNDCPFPTVCAGSVAHAGKASYTEYAIRGANVCALRRVFDVERSEFCDGEAFELELKG
jgi:3',5'-cyclic AMP phosphodiesterase CpdA